MTPSAALLWLLVKMSAPTADADRLALIRDEAYSVVRAEPSAKLSADNAAGLLLSVMFTESALRTGVESCDPSDPYSMGDNGASVGLGQVHAGPNWEGYSKAAICADRVLQITLAWHALKGCLGVSRSIASVVRCYASGDPALDTDMSRRHQNSLVLFRRVTGLRISL